MAHAFRRSQHLPTLHTLRINLQTPITHRTRSRRHTSPLQSQFANGPHPRHRRSLPTAAAASSSSSTADDWNILDSPGLTPPRSQLPRDDFFSKIGQRLLSALAAVAPALASPELLRRVAVTLCMLALVQVGHFIPLPGLNLPSLLESTSTSLTSTAATVAEGVPRAFLSLTAALTGSTELPGNMFILSITPYMTAHFSVSMLQLVPEMRKVMNELRDQGRQGRETINSYVNIAFVLCALAQCIIEAKRMSPLAAGGIGNSVFFQIQAATTLFAGAVICKFAVQTVEQWGIGDGPSIVIGAGIALAYSQTLTSVLSALLALPPHPAALAAAIALNFLLVAVVVWVQGIELRLPMTFFFPRRSSVRSSHPVLRLLNKGVDSTAALDTQQLLPLRLSPAGTRQLLFANFWVSTFAAPLQWLGLGNFLSNPWCFAALVFILESVSIADATPRQTADFLAQNDTGIKGLSPGIATERFLSLRRAQMKALNAAFIASVSLIARAVDVACAVLIGVPLGCLNLLLLVSTVVGGARQVDALTQGRKVERMIAEEYSLLEEVVGQRGR